jgi:GntR family transcriptional regulator
VNNRFNLKYCIDKHRIIRYDWAQDVIQLESKMMINDSIFHPLVERMGENCDNCSLAQKVAEQIRAMIMEGTLTPESQLPNEPDLSGLLKVSRSTVRSALTILEQTGFVQRRWGVGTFIAKDPPTYNNLSINSGVTQLIRSSGAEPGFVEFMITERPASERVANLLSLELDEPVVVMERVRLANERRVVFSLDIIPKALFRNHDYEIPLGVVEQFLYEKQSMYTFFRERLALEIHHGIARIRPLTAEAYIAEKLGIPINSNIFFIEQVDYGTDGEPLALTDEYYDADAFTFYFYRSS